jgi:hypothetical protein
MKQLFALLIGCVLSSLSLAQTFRMPCDVSGVIAELDNTKLPQERITVEIQSMGKNIFLKIPDSKNYFVQASSLETDEFTGKNLTTQSQMGAYRKSKITGKESEIRIERLTRVLHAYNDTTYMGKPVRIVFDGPCTPPAQ